MTGACPATVEVPRRPTDDGSGTVLVLAVVALAVAGALAAAALAQVVSARHRAEAAADLGAVAAAQSALDASGDPCGRAAQVVASNSAQLASCVTTGEHAWVTTSVPVKGALAHLGPATAKAHAGPGGM